MDRESVKSMLAALEGKPLQSAYDLMTRGNCLAELERWEEALADYDAAVKLEPEHEGGMCWYNRGNTLRSLKRLEDAAQS